MGNRFILTESEKNDIRKMYGLIMEQQSDTPTCNDAGCSGRYVGPEFLSDNSDIAHQYSNVITKAVASKLKELYKRGTYVKVDFKGIKLSTKGMGSGNVTYDVVIPFTGVQNKCDARTGFAHVGGWGHSPELGARRSEILSYKPDGKNNVVVGNQLDISDLTKTKEGLQEYWIQWKHSQYQSDCGDNNPIENKQNDQTFQAGQTYKMVRTKDGLIYDIKINQVQPKFVVANINGEGTYENQPLKRNNMELYFTADKKGLAGNTEMGEFKLK